MFPFVTIKTTSSEPIKEGPICNNENYIELASIPRSSLHFA